MIEYDQRTTLVRNADVLVVGGGAAGLAAAVTSSRQGLRVILVERYGFCGGGAVAGMSGTICGMYEASDNRDARPVQVVHGFLDTFVTAMEQKGGLGPPLRYGKTFSRVHDPFVWREVADDLLERDAGFTSQRARGVIEAEIAIHARQAQHLTAAVHCRVPVASAEAARDRAAVVEPGLDLLRCLRLGVTAVHAQVSAPAGEARHHSWRHPLYCLLLLHLSLVARAPSRSMTAPALLACRARALSEEQG